MTGSSITKRITVGTAVALAAAATAVPSALAGGEPKNQAPFTRIVSSRALTLNLARVHAASPLAIMGETKNQAPFIRVRATTGLMITGEAKNELPFTRR
jgi:hypothetical protein